MSVVLQAETTFKILVRSHLPLTATLASQQASASRPFSRAVFLFGYADSALLHSLENTFRALNARCLGLDFSPGAMSAHVRAASTAGGLTGTFVVDVSDHVCCTTGFWYTLCMLCNSLAI